MLTKGAIGNLINRYKAVLTKCNLINVFGSLAVASMLVAGSAGVAEAEDYTHTNGETYKIAESPVQDLDENSLDGWVWKEISGKNKGSACNVENDIYIKNSLFIKNSSKKNGGAVYLDNGTFTFENIEFDNNTSGDGGAIYIKDGKINIEDCTFTNNAANGNGGAIYIHGFTHPTEYKVIIKDCTFTNNSSINQYGFGGAIYNVGHLDFEGSNIFSDNKMVSSSNDISNEGTIKVLSGASISLDGGYTGTGTIIFEDGSTFIVEDASKIIKGSVASLLLDGAGIVDKTGRLIVQDGAKLKLNKVAVDTTYQIADNFKGIYSNYTTNDQGSVIVEDSAKITDDALTAGWNGSDLISDTHLLVDAKTKVVENADGSYGVIVEVKEATVNSSGEGGSEEGDTPTSGVASILPGVAAGNALTALVKAGIDVNSEVMGVRFLSRATDTDYLSGGATPQTFTMARAVLAPSAPADEAALREFSVKLINEVFEASVTAGVQNTALRLSDAASENVLHHLSLGNFDSGNSIHADGTDFWATPMYGNTYTSGMSASGASVRGNYGGIAFGADTQVGEVLGGKVRVGAALNGGGGKSETKGTATSTQNDYNFGGINLYAGWNKGNLNVIANLGYGIGDNEVTMALPASMEMGSAKADVDTSVITADLRAEYQLNTNWLDILPHAGVRYTALRTDSHDLKINGSVLNSVEADTQHIVQFPIGVTVSKNFDAWGWNVKPQADVSFIPAVGDKDMNTKVRFSGVDAVDSIDTRIMDGSSWAGMVGVKAEKGNLSFGLNYGIQASSHETDQKVQATIGWKF